TERSYIECTASAISALARLREASGEDSRPLVQGSFREQIGAAMSHGLRFLRGAQRPDGAFSGFWGVCFTYATFHAIEALHAAGMNRHDPSITRAVRFLLSIQKADGGW